MTEGRIVSLGQFVVDTFRYLDADGRETGEAKPDMIGGGATYFLIGARAFLPPSVLGQIIDRDSLCFPAEFDRQLAAYGWDMVAYRERTDGVAYSRARNTYQGDVRRFDFLTPFIRLFPDDLVRTRLFRPALPAALHFANRAEHARETIEQVDRIARDGVDDKGYGKGWAPEIFWEPFPATCVPQNAALIRALAPRVTVLSPNHIEALSLLGLAHGALDRSAAASGLDADDPRHRGTAREAYVKGQVERVAREMGAWGCRVGVVVRCGGLGACVAQKRDRVARRGDSITDTEVDDTIAITWVPAYHQPVPTPTGPRADPAIRDVTGGGNAFMGGLAAGLRQGLPLERAALWGSASASLAIEQDGLPKLGWEGRAGGEETWNAGRVKDRVEVLERRMGWRAAE